MTVNREIDMLNVILCGGSGTRLWPLSRECKPKQFINFANQKSLLQNTIIGNRKCSSNFMIVCNNEHFFLVQNQLEECKLTPQKYILEPTPRNTAAAVCFAALAAHKDEILLITPSDHYIDYSEQYFSAIEQAKQFAEAGHVAVFGITPRSPETGYGYIEVLSDNTVKKFHEKPSLEVAEKYIQEGHYYWNSGMLCAKAGVILTLMQQHAPNILHEAQTAFYQSTFKKEDVPVHKIPLEEMRKIPSASIDYALLEKMDHLKCVQGQFRWSDVGSFDSLFTHLAKDADGNAIDAQHFISVDAKNNLVMGGKRTISMIDVEGLAVVDTPDALLISRLGSTQKVRNVVDHLKAGNTTIHKHHPAEQRPWGSFAVLETGEMFKVKQFIVVPGKRLSLQKHRHRSEHWVVVSGTALVTVGSEQRMLYPNQSIFIQLGEVHRVENPGKENLIIIEVQYGAYTGEDDIIRLQDDFSRLVEEKEAVVTN